jgi:hypothetical protein
MTGKTLIEFILSGHGSDNLKALVRDVIRAAGVQPTRIVPFECGITGSITGSLKA